MMILIIGGLRFQDESKDPDPSHLDWDLDRNNIVWNHFILDKEKEKAKRCKSVAKNSDF